MTDFRIPLGTWVEDVLDWVKENLAWLLEIIRTVIAALVDGLTDALLAVPAPALIIVFALLAWAIRSWQLAVGTLVTFFLIVAMDVWEEAMQTLALVLIAAIIAIIIAVPIGILAARRNSFSAVVRPILDFMQTMPALVYLIPAMVFFSIGTVPGVVATIIFALPPGVRFTELGIRGVDAETVEAGRAFGASPGQILRGIQLPLATPTIMAGINQVIMLSMSMAVIAGMAGADGLGKSVVASLATLNVAQGVEAGLGVVILAVYLDRVTAALGSPADFRTSGLHVLRQRRLASRRAGAAAVNRRPPTLHPLPPETSGHTVRMRPTRSRRHQRTERKHHMKMRHITGATAVAAVSALALAGCASGDQASEAGAEGEDKGTIVLGFIPSWTDGLSTAYLLEDQLGKLGYTVEMNELTEPAALYTGLANGDIDMYPSAWPEVTHASYMEQFGDSIEDLGAYYDNAKLTIAVPSYVDIDSIEDLAADPDRFGGQIIGIEPGAGLTEQTQEVMMPEYGLDGSYTLATSSTAGMLTSLDTAIANEEDIVVTLWRPFWANSAYDVKDLEDPKGAMGDPEGLHFLGKSGFSEEFADAAELISSIKLDDTQYGSLEDLVVNEYGDGQEAEAVDAWLAENPDAFAGQLAG